MIKSFFKDSAVYTVGTLITRGIQIIMVPIYTRLLTPADYGIMDLFIITGNFANVIVALEIGQGFARYYADAPTQKDKQEYSSTSFWFVLIMYCFFLVIAFLFANKFNEIIIGGNGTSLIVFQVAMLSIWGSGVFNYLRNQLRWYLKSKYFAVTSIIFTLIAYTITIILMIVFKTGIIGVFWGLTIGYLAGNFASWYFSKSNYRFLFNWKKFKEMLSFSLPLVPGSVGSILLLYIDRIAIKDLMTLGDVGIFGVAYRFAAIVTLVMSGFQTALIPLIYQNYKNIETPKEVSKIFNYFLVIMLFCIMGLSLFSHEILVIFTTPSYYKAAEIIPIISFATLFLTLYIFTPGLSIAKKTKTSTAIYICSALLNTGLNFTLIPIWGIMGAGLSTLFSGIALFAANVYFSQKNFYIPYNWKKIITAFISSAIIILLAILFEYLNIINKNIMAVIKLVMLIFTEWFIIRVVIGNQKFFVLINEIKKIIIAKSQKILK